MKYGICNLATVPLRASASDEAEIVSQLVFGDHVEVLQDGKPWVKVKNAFDNYEGWMDFKQLTAIDQSTYEKGLAHPAIPVTQKALNLTGPHGDLTIFLGATLPFFNGTSCQLGKETYTLNETIESVKYGDIKRLSEFYLNAPYLWGGKSMYGIDCSGLTQNVYRAVGIHLLRDASQQVNQGQNIQWDERQIGDLLFYTTSSDKITHVGILISKDEIIHAHGRVRIDHCDLKGIFNDEQDRYTHHFHSVKRYKSTLV